MDLENKTVMVTGASGEIGFEIVRDLGSSGANVVAQWGRNKERVIEATADIPRNRRLLLQADFSQPSDTKELWKRAVDWRGRVDVLVNNAAVMPEAGIDDPDDIWDAAWDRALTINVTQPAELMRRAVTHYLGHGGGVLITVSSWSGQRGSGNPKLAAYAASKAAAAAITKTFARSFAQDNVLAYCIAPGPVDTDMTRRSAANQGGMKSVLSTLSMRELVPPHEIAGLVRFLAGGTARHLSGATLDVNGATYIR